MKKIFVEILDTIIFAMEHLAKHPKLVTAICAITWAVHLILNNVYYGKPVPISGIILRPWMAYTNVILMGCCCGFTAGYVNVKSKKG